PVHHVLRGVKEPIVHREEVVDGDVFVVARIEKDRIVVDDRRGVRRVDVLDERVIRVGSGTQKSDAEGNDPMREGRPGRKAEARIHAVVSRKGAAPSQLLSGKRSTAATTRGSSPPHSWKN